MTGATFVVRLRDEAVSARLHRRTPVVCLGLGVALALALVASLAGTRGELSVPEVLRALTGDPAPPGAFVVWELRMPRALLAPLIGAALGAAGAIFQSLTRNPLGSPDVIGFTWGAAAAGVLGIVVLETGSLGTALVAMGGGALTATVVLGLSRGSGGRGGVSGQRLVLVGIGTSSGLAALTTYLVAVADLGSAQQARVWLTGSLAGRGWEYVWPVAVALAVVFPFAAALMPRLRMMELGEEAAHALGVRVGRARPALIAAAVALTAVATAAAGPVAFVALAAPQLARRLTRASGPGLAASALTGALLLASGDLLAQRLLRSGELPVGVVTGALGGVYLLWLLNREWRTT